MIDNYIYQTGTQVVKSLRVPAEITTRPGTRVPGFNPKHFLVLFEIMT